MDSDFNEAKRFCRLVRSSKDEFYGFDLKTYADGRHVVKTVAKDTPAHKAGLLAGDVILEVNGVPTQNMDKNDIINKILMFPKQLELLLANSKNTGYYDKSLTISKDEKYKNKKKIFSNLHKRSRSSSLFFNSNGNKANPLLE